MNRMMKAMMAGLVLVGASSMSFAQNGPGGGRGGPGGPPMVRPGMPGMMGPNALDEVIFVIADLNMRPNFTLSEAQKTKIQTIRDDFKKAQETWREENKEELEKIQQAMQELWQAGPDADREAWRDVMESNMALMETAPNGEDEAAKVQDVLTPEQVTALETRRDEIQAEREEMMGGQGGGRGQAGPGGGRGQNGGAQQGGPGGGRGN